MHATHATEVEIIEQLRNRDPEGLAAAYDKYGRAAYALLVRITHDKLAAEDLLQELFLRLWNRGRDFDAARGTLGVWIMSIARNMAIDHVRSAHTRFSSRLGSMDHLDALCFGRHPSASQSRIDDIGAIREAFAALNANEKQVLELAYFDGFSQTEIAERLQQPLGTVKSRMRSALERLRTAMKGTQP
jgi:RNA polymerase sigma-70 factor (ECF subfamily)